MNDDDEMITGTPAPPPTEPTPSPDVQPKGGDAAPKRRRDSATPQRRPPAADGDTADRAHRRAALVCKAVSSVAPQVAASCLSRQQVKAIKAWADKL